MEKEDKEMKIYQDIIDFIAKGGKDMGNAKCIDTSTIFDDWTFQNNDDINTNMWTQVCEKCSNRHHLIAKNLDIGAGHGICGVKGCIRKSDHYYDFNGKVI